MAHTTLLVSNGFLQEYPFDKPHALAISIGSAGWYEWLKHHRSFRFEHQSMTYTARKEQRPGGWYWYASRRAHGTLRTLYLGKSEDLTLERLILVGQQLGNVPPSPSPDIKPVQPFSATQPDPLLTTKLTVPPAKADLVSRPRLIARMQESLRRKLLLVIAPAGYGKTTLLGAWIAQSTMPVAWVSLDESDNDPLHFWSYSLAALNTLRPGTSAALYSLLQASPTEPFLTTLINTFATFSEQTALVFDDYHLIRSNAIHAALNFLVEHLPPCIHVVIASRSEPPLALARFYARDDAAKLGLADLRFTMDEAEMFLTRVMDLPLSTQQIDVLRARTEGWVAGLQLAALSMRHSESVTHFIEAFSGDDHYIFDFFVEEVLHGLPEHMQQFLLQTSILDHLSGSLCDAVTGQNGGAEMLMTLEQANLFVISIDTQRRWYRYHHLFADHLRHRLSLIQPDLIAILRQRAAVWYAGHGQSHEAISYALAAADFALAADLLEEFAITMLPYGRAETMLAWLERLPADMVRTRPGLALAQAFAFLALSQFAAAEPYAHYAHLALQTCSDLDTSARQTLQGYIEAVRGTIAINLGEASAAIDHSHQALQLLTQEDVLSHYWIAQVVLNLADAYHGNDPAAARAMYVEAVSLNRAAGNLATAVTALSTLGRISARQGFLYESEQTYRQALTLGEEGGVQLPWPSTGKAYIYLGEVLYEWNDLIRAEQHVRHGIHLCEQWRHIYHMAEGMMILAQVQVALGNLKEGSATLEHAKHLVEETTLGASRRPVSIPRFRWLSNQIASAQTEILVRRGDLTAATDWADQCGLSVTDPSNQNPTEYDATLARLLVALGRPAAAAAWLRRLSCTTEVERWNSDMIKILVAWVAALDASGARDQATAVLERALRLAEPGGYIRTFLDEGACIQRVLSYIVSRGTASAYIHRLLAAFRAEGHDVPPPGTALADPLSERELMVLHLLADGLSSSQIARELIVAVSTVRTHIKHIYAKLDAHTRGEAVERARTLRLI